MQITDMIVINRIYEKLLIQWKFVSHFKEIAYSLQLIEIYKTFLNFSSYYKVL